MMGYNMMGMMGNGFGLWCLIPVIVLAGTVYLAVRYGIKHGFKDGNKNHG